MAFVWNKFHAVKVYSNQVTVIELFPKDYYVTGYKEPLKLFLKALKIILKHITVFKKIICGLPWWHSG